VVFDSSAKYQEVSLKNVLLTGPDLTNSLLGVLLRFRKESVAVIADIEQMLYCFYVQESHRNFLRFMWFEDNDPEKNLVEYRISVHIFGNSPSAAIATYGLRETADSDKNDIDVYDFIINNFYVDDGFVSLSDCEKAVDLIQRTQRTLMKGGNLKLHKIASNSKKVMNAFHSDDLAKGIKDLDLYVDAPPLQISLGLSWNILSDNFTFLEM